MSNSKYRISCQAMPNPERAKQADLLRRKLQMAQKIRANDVTNEKEGKKSGGSTTGRK